MNIFTKRKKIVEKMSDNLDQSIRDFLNHTLLPKIELYLDKKIDHKKTQTN